MFKLAQDSPSSCHGGFLEGALTEGLRTVKNSHLSSVGPNRGQAPKAKELGTAVLKLGAGSLRCPQIRGMSQDLNVL